MVRDLPVQPLILLGVLFIVSMGLLAVQDFACAVPRETQEEKVKNFQQQARGGLFQRWTFDNDQANRQPVGFVRQVSNDELSAEWMVQTDETAPTPPHVISGSSVCTTPCYQLLLAGDLEYEYPDLSVRVRAPKEKETVGTGGVIFGARDRQNFYAAVVDLGAARVHVTRMVSGQETMLAHASVTLKPVDWHALRVQRNTIVSKDFIEVFVDGTLVLSVEDQALGSGQIGLAVFGKSSMLFDSFHAVPLFSHRPLSLPPAY